MRIAATTISAFALLLCSCSLEPKSSFDAKAALSQLKGPDTGSFNGALLQQAQQAESVGDYKQAAQLYKQLADKDPSNVDFALGLADDMRRAGDSGGALRVLDTVIKKDPRNAAAYEDKGLCLMNTGEFAEAGSAFGMAMKYDGKRWRTLNAIGILFAMKNDEKSAFAYYQAALDQSTDNPSVLNNMGLTLAMDKQYAKSIEALERARRHVPSDSPQMKNIDMNLALVYAIDGRLNEAEQIAAPHLTKEGLYNNMGFYAYLAKNTDLSKGYLNMALTQSPVYYERAWKNLAAVGGDVSSPEPPAGKIDAPDLSSFNPPAIGISSDNSVSPAASQPPATQLTQTPNPAVAPSSTITPAVSSATPATSGLTSASNTATLAGMNPDIVMHSASTGGGAQQNAGTTGNRGLAAPAASDDDSRKAFAEIEKTDVASGTKSANGDAAPTANPATNSSN